MSSAAHERGQILGQRMALARIASHLREKASEDGTLSFTVEELIDGAAALIGANPKTKELRIDYVKGDEFLQWYVDQATRTESDDFNAIASNLVALRFGGDPEYPIEDEGVEMLRLLHGAIGLATESGELLDALKKSIFYSKELDRVNIAEELGDIGWYMAIIIDALGANFAEILYRNIEKLRTRFPNKFTNEDALDRDLTAERETLES